MKKVTGMNAGRRKPLTNGYWLMAILSAFLFLPLCANATVIDFYDHDVGTIQNGDSYNFVTLHDFATVTMSGGVTNGLQAYDTSIFNFQSGTIDVLFQFYGSSIANINGGTINRGFNMYDNSILNIKAGTVLGATMGDSTVLNVSGGDLRGYFYVNNIVNIYARDLSIVPYYVQDKLASGHWADGTSFQFLLGRAQVYNTQIVFHEIPEPTSMFLLGFGMILLRKNLSK